MSEFTEKGVGEKGVGEKGVGGRSRHEIDFDNGAYSRT